MGSSGGHRRKSAIEDGEALAAVMDAEADALACGTVDDYTRARARTDADRLFAQPRFAPILATARAETYPIALTLVAEMLESTLASQVGDRAARLRALLALARTAFARHPVRTTDDVAQPFVASLLARMPIHDDLGPDNYPFLRKSMRAMLVAVRERCVTNMNASVLVDTLTRGQCAPRMCQRFG